MTFSFLGGECAPAILDIRPAVEPGIVPPNVATIDLVRLFALDRLPVGRRRLVCRWHRADGRLACIWEPDIVPIPQR
jgi:hypothetical protein